MVVEKQIPSLRCGMTARKARATAEARARATARVTTRKRSEFGERMNDSLLLRVISKQQAVFGWKREWC